MPFPFTTLIIISVVFLNSDFVICDFDYEIPDVTLKAYTPSGLEASIPDSPEIRLFAFHAKINKDISNAEPGDYYEDIDRAENGRWIFWDPSVKLDVGDVVNYWVFVQHNKMGYMKDATNWKVEKLHTKTICKNSLTLLNGEKTCSGDLIFEEEFNGAKIDENKWLIEHRIPNPSEGPDFEFVSYQNNKDVCYIKDDFLHIKPRIENNVTGVLDLSEGCTSTRSIECSFKQEYFRILPPVTSGNIYSKFNFTYGVFEIKAKLPAGEWIYPQIYLRHLGRAFYKIFLAYARGNDKLVGNNNNDDIGARLLFGGPVEDPTEPKRSKFLKSIRSDTPYTNQMHVFKLKWEPNRMTFYVDDIQFGKAAVLFDKPVVINLGVGVGGINDFPDGYDSNNERNKKPWENGDPKQALVFHEKRNVWSSTWKENALQVDYVKVWAI